jgi:hypothetical protein
MTSRACPERFRGPGAPIDMTGPRGARKTSKRCVEAWITADPI